MTFDPHALVGRTVGPYTLDRLLGQGGFAWVFAGSDANGGRVAVKVLRPRYAGDPQFETRFRNEFKTAQDLAHPNIVRIHGVGKDGNVTWFAMDLYENTLGSLVADRGPVAESTLLTVIADVLRDNSEDDRR